MLTAEACRRKAVDQPRHREDAAEEQAGHPVSADDERLRDAVDVLGQQAAERVDGLVVAADQSEARARLVIQRHRPDKVAEAPTAADHEIGALVRVQAQADIPGHTLLVKDHGAAGAGVDDEIAVIVEDRLALLVGQRRVAVVEGALPPRRAEQADLAGERIFKVEVAGVYFRLLAQHLYVFARVAAAQRPGEVRTAGQAGQRDIDPMRLAVGHGTQREVSVEARAAGRERIGDVIDVGVGEFVARGEPCQIAERTRNRRPHKDVEHIREVLPVLLRVERQRAAQVADQPGRDGTRVEA
ncbi:hypothetical protein E6W36_02420 [Hankyongella ginsenosidimutans]|uniref:Uncharacterized protein n=1 Tax=Hankyongella ginsenosidimutans TaxID=1763828 RepID=A0A4D7CBN5_9SPHN|nr:hypothetical protein [Hankyongella ginsenosidimutans]QCI78872.1 hypothetical protein E6W36_02420 [Hankyongella ginsenosidimutans]